MSESIETFWKEYESLASYKTDQTTTVAPWIVREQEFFGSYGLSSEHVKLVAGLGLMSTCLALTLFLLFLCSRRLRGSQLEPVMAGRGKVLTDKLQPPRYEEVVEVDSRSLPSYWQASQGESIPRR